MTAAEEASVLLALAGRHLRALGGMADAATFDDAVFGFHAQQAAELALKAWLTLRGVAYPRSHDLGVLLHLLALPGAESASWRDLIELNAFAVQHRYDVLDPGERALDRPALLQRLAALRDRVGQAIRDTAVGA
jgi:HEPN domain-containing protein